jgi:mono/diheme cytochrome c family protein
MPKRHAITISLVAGLVLTGLISAAQQEAKVKQVPVKSTSAQSGSQMFEQYCATCHGKDGKGSGPAAAAMKAPPADLTQLARKNGGKFPTDHIYQVIGAESDLPAHGSREMPVWGPIFRQMERGDAGMIKLRIVNLTQYIQSLQAK